MARDIAIVMRTVHRANGHAYLRETLDALSRARAWWSPRLAGVDVIDADAGARVESLKEAMFGYAWMDAPGVDEAHPETMTVHPASDVRAPALNAAQALLTGAARRATWVLFLEDDVDVCDRFLDGVGAWLDGHADDRWRIATFGTTWPAVLRAAQRGRDVAMVPLDSFFGTTCYAIRTADAQRFGAWLRRNPMYNGHVRSHDLLIARWSREAHPNVSMAIASAPSFVQHVGAVSGVSPGRRRTFTFPSWPGRAWKYGDPFKQQQQQTQEASC